MGCHFLSLLWYLFLTRDSWYMGVGLLYRMICVGRIPHEIYTQTYSAEYQLGWLSSSHQRFLESGFDMAHFLCNYPCSESQAIITILKIRLWVVASESNITQQHRIEMMAYQWPYIIYQLVADKGLIKIMLTVSSKGRNRVWLKSSKTWARCTDLATCYLFNYLTTWPLLSAKTD